MAEDKKSKHISSEPLNHSDARWVTLEKATYTDPNSTVRTWEYSRRLTRPATSPIDGVDIIAMLTNPPPSFPLLHPRFSSPSASSSSSSSASPLILLQKQYRPPLRKVVVEVPAGLIDEGETAMQCAVRELREETGYVGAAVDDAADDDNDASVSPIMFRDPGFCNTNMRVVQLTVDLSAAENQVAKPEPDEGEFIETFAVPIEELWGELRRMEREDGGDICVDATVGMLAEGWEMARRFALRR